MSVKPKRADQEEANRNDGGKDGPKDGNLHILSHIIEYFY